MSPTSPILSPCHVDSLKCNMVSPQPAYLNNLASTISYNLQHQHDWTSLSTHNHSFVTGHLFPRPLISGIPPRRLYVHPDKQVEILKAEHESGTHLPQTAEREWVLPMHLAEKWTLKAFAKVFDAMDDLCPESRAEVKGSEEQCKADGKWHGIKTQKRLLLAILHGDSTVVYYIMHDGIVKPRQN